MNDYSFKIFLTWGFEGVKFFYFLFISCKKKPLIYGDKILDGSAGAATMPQNVNQDFPGRKAGRLSFSFENELVAFRRYGDRISSAIAGQAKAVASLGHGTNHPL